MGTRRPTGDRVPFGDLTNTTHGGLVPPNGDRNEKKRQRERERYATISGENSSEINKKRRERYAMNIQGRVDLNSNMAAHSTDGNTTNEIDENSEWLHMHSTHNNGVGQLSDSNTRNEMGENSDWLHRQSTYSSSLEQLSDGQVSLSNIGGTGDLDDINTEHDISTVYETGSGYAPSPINQVVTCPKERRNARDRARRASMSPQQKALLNKRRRELYATKNAPKKSAKMLQMTSKETAQSTDGPIPLSIGIPSDIDDTLTETDTNTAHETDGPIPLRIEVPGDIDDTLAETDINTVL